MKQFFKNLFNLNKIVNELIEVKKIASEAKNSTDKLNKDLVRLTNLENKFNEITTR